MSTRTRVLAVLVAVSVLSLAACGDDDEQGTEGEVSSTTASTGATATTEDTTTTTPAGCPTAVAIDGEVVVEDPVALDADGDGVDDEAQLYAIGEQSLALEVTYGAGGSSVLLIADDNVFTGAPVRIDSVVDVDGDSDDDVWVVIGSGASTEIVTLVLAHECELIRPHAAGQPNAFPVGASVGFLSGVECVDLDGNDHWDGFLVHEAELDDETTYAGTSTWWTPDPLAETPDQLVEQETTPFAVDLGAEDGSRYTSLTCG